MCSSYMLLLAKNALTVFKLNEEDSAKNITVKVRKNSHYFELV